MLADNFRLEQGCAESVIGSGLWRQTDRDERQPKRPEQTALLERNDYRRIPPGSGLGYDDAEENWQNAGCRIE